MVITLKVDSEAEARLRRQAQVEGLSVEAYVQRCLEAPLEALPPAAAGVETNTRGTHAGEGDQPLESVCTLPFDTLFPENAHLAALAAEEAARARRTPPPGCAQCGSRHIVVGHVRGFFSYPHGRAHKTSFSIFEPDPPGVSLSGPGYVCLACGLVWSHVDRNKLYTNLDIWAPPEWRERLRAWREQQGEDLLRPAQHGNRTNPAELLRAAPTQEQDPEDERA